MWLSVGSEVQIVCIILVVCSNNVSLLHHFFDITTFTLLYDCNIEKSFIFGKVAIKEHRYLPVPVYTQRS